MMYVDNSRRRKQSRSFAIDTEPNEAYTTTKMANISAKNTYRDVTPKPIPNPVYEVVH